MKTNEIKTLKIGTENTIVTEKTNRTEINDKKNESDTKKIKEKNLEKNMNMQICSEKVNKRNLEVIKGSISEKINIKQSLENIFKKSPEKYSICKSYSNSPAKNQSSLSNINESKFSNKSNKFY